MPVTDPIADMLTRIRNANKAGAEDAVIPASRMKVGIAKILREEGFIKHYKILRTPAKGARKEKAAEGEPAAGAPQDKRNSLEKQSLIRVYLKYGTNREPVLIGLKRISKPGLRRYVSAKDIPQIQGGIGITILSTSRGLLTGAQCRKRNIGGELLCAIW